MKLSWDRVMIVLTCLLVGHLPFVSLFSAVIPGIGAMKDILCILICVCALLNTRKVPIHWSIVVVLVYSLNVVLGLVTNDNLLLVEKIDAFRYRCEYAITFALLFHALKRSKDDLIKMGDYVWKTLFYTGVMVALIGLIEFVAPEIVYSIYGETLTPHLSVALNGEAARRLVSTMGNPINLGLQMSLAVVAGLYLLEKNKACRTKKYVYLSSIFVFIWIAVFTYSRTAYVAIIGVMAAYCLSPILFNKGKRNKYKERANRMKRILLDKTWSPQKKRFVAIVGVVAVLLVIGIQTNGVVFARFADINLMALLRNTRFVRAYNAFQASDGGLVNILLGHGVGNIVAESRHYVFEFGYASLLYESGLLGAGLFLFMIVKSLFSGRHMIRTELPHTPLAIAFVSCLAGFCVAMITEDVYFQLPICLYFWFSVFSIDYLRDER